MTFDARTRLLVLRDEWESCQKCEIRDGTAQVCFGAGSSRARFLFITDRPDFSDIEEGAPLVSGEVAAIFDTTLSHSGLSRSDVFVTPLTGCVPYLIRPATEENEETVDVRDPTREEVANCLSRIYDIIYSVDPEVIIAMGEGPWKALVSASARGRFRTITTAQGHMFECEVPGQYRTLRYPVIAAPGVSQIIKNPSASKHGPTAVLVRIIYTAAHHVGVLDKTNTKLENLLNG
jgi:uracil-DNA glycosylase family 4